MRLYMSRALARPLFSLLTVTQLMRPARYPLTGASSLKEVCRHAAINSEVWAFDLNWGMGSFIYYGLLLVCGRVVVVRVEVWA